MKYFLSFFLLQVPLYTFGQATDTSRAVLTLDEVVVSVNKTEDSERRVAQPVERILQTEIEARAAMTTAELLSQSANVRGFEASRILLVVDGVRLNNLIYRAGHLQNVLTLDHQSLEKVEVLYGPSSTVYGSDALGGVLHF